MLERVIGAMSEMTRWRHEKADIGPKPVKLNGRNFYFEEEVQTYFDELTRIMYEQRPEGWRV